MADTSGNDGQLTGDGSGTPLPPVGPDADEAPELVECKAGGCTKEALIEGYCGGHQHRRYAKTTKGKG